MKKKKKSLTTLSVILRISYRKLQHSRISVRPGVWICDSTIFLSTRHEGTFCRRRVDVVTDFITLYGPRKTRLVFCHVFLNSRSVGARDVTLGLPRPRISHREIITTIIGHDGGERAWKSSIPVRAETDRVSGRRGGIHRSSLVLKRHRRQQKKTIVIIINIVTPQSRIIL